MLTQALVGQAKARGQANPALQLGQEKALRPAAEKAAAENQKRYIVALQNGQKALAGKVYPTAIVHFQEAAKYYKTDVVLTGLRQAEAGRDQGTIQAKAVQQEAVAKEQRAAQFK